MVGARTVNESLGILKNVDAARRKIVLVGGGGHCKSVIDALVNLNLYHDIFVTDQAPVEGLHVFGAQYAGNDDMLPELYDNGIREAFISIGSIKSPAVRKNVFEKLQKIGFEFPNIIDCSAEISRSAVVGKGVFIGKKAVVNSNAKVEDFTIINTGAIIEHDCCIGKFTHVSVGATVCGNVNIEDDAFVGANATIVQGVKIGMNSVIGAGSVVLRDVPKGSLVKGLWTGGGGNIVASCIRVLLLKENGLGLILCSLCMAG